MQQFKAENNDFDTFLQAKIDSFLYGDKDFIYKNDIGKVWEEYVASLPSSVWIDSRLFILVLAIIFRIYFQSPSIILDYEISAIVCQVT